MDIELLLAPLTRALSQSQALQSLAEASDWDSFETLVQQRQQGLLSLGDSEYLESLAAANLEAQAAELIQSIQAINVQLTQLADKNRAEVASELQQTLKAGKAIDAYSQ